MGLIARNEKQIGAALRRHRKQAGLSQAALATKMQARQGTVSRLERACRRCRSARSSRR